MEEKPFLGTFVLSGPNKNCVAYKPVKSSLWQQIKDFFANKITIVMARGREVK